MSAAPELVFAAALADQYVVSFGTSGAVGVFIADHPLPLRRGDRVVIDSPRGIEVGAVLCPASLRQARWLGTEASGRLLRQVTPEDDEQLSGQDSFRQHLFEAARRQVVQQELPIEVLDVEIMLDGRRAIVQYLGDEAATETFAEMLERQFRIDIRVESLAGASARGEEQSQGGCGKPDCGRGQGGCSACGTQGGCSTCGSHGGVDLRPYFAHLREKMERERRTLL
jgi:cell fate regulator YaaT (PSP1 superfamily)